MTTRPTGKCNFTIKTVADGLAKEIEKKGEAWKAENWFYWPPDVFALTSIFLKTTGIYRYMVSPHPDRPSKRNADDLPHTPISLYQGSRLPCGYGKKKMRQLEENRREWFKWLRGEQKEFPEFLKEYVEVLFEEKTGTIFDGKEYSYEYCDMVMRLHALADAVCPGFGILSMDPYGPISALYFLANFLLAAKGSLSRLPKHCGIVLPKMRTPQRGLTLRSFSHHLTFHESEVDVRWRTVPWADRNERSLNIVAIPMPYEIKSESFKNNHYPVEGNDVKDVKYFEYEPKGEEAKVDVDGIIDLLDQAHSEVDRVHLLVFPELAMTEEQASYLRRALANRIKPPRQIPMMITGIRERKIGGEPKKVNEVQLSVFFAQKWYKLGQGKHHRWKIDRRQIQQYSLGGSLNVQYQWWEAIDINRRELTFLSPNGWLTLCPLICEDLAQLEPVSDLIRGVGPTLVVAVLMDGPQLAHRWPARYVSVLADDPGTSVLTLTSLGMAVRSRAKDKPANRTVALWKDLETDWEQIELKDGAQAVLLTIHADEREEFTADGRSDGGSSALLVLQGIHYLHTRGAHGNNGHESKEIPESSPGDVEELTEFSYLASAFIDAPGTLIKEFRDRVTNKKHKIEYIEATKPFEDLWDQIKVALREEARRHRSEPDFVPRKAGSRFDIAVETLCDFISAENFALDDLMDFEEMAKKGEEDSRLRRDEKDAWKKKKKEAEREWKKERLKRWSVIATKALERLERIESSSISDEEKRLDRIPYVSVIWAIHNRLLNHRKDSKWTRDADYQELLRSVEDWAKTKSQY